MKLESVKVVLQVGCELLSRGTSQQSIVQSRSVPQSLEIRLRYFVRNCDFFILSAEINDHFVGDAKFCSGRRANCKKLNRTVVTRRRTVCLSHSQILRIRRGNPRAHGRKNRMQTLFSHVLVSPRPRCRPRCEIVRMRSKCGVPMPCEVVQHVFFAVCTYNSTWPCRIFILIPYKA